MTEKHNYPSLEESGEDKASQTRNAVLLKQEMAKTHPNTQAVKSLMVRTFSERRKVILGGGKLVADACKDYPFLKKAKFVSELVHACKLIAHL